MRYLLIKAGIVVNAIEASAGDIAHLTGYDAIIASAVAGPGWRYQSGVFTPPEPVAAPPAQLTQLAFLRRFTAPERIAIRGSADPVVIDFLHLLSLAREIRLDDPDTLAGVGYLEQAGLVVAGRAAEILAG